MVRISRDDVFKVVLAALLSLCTYIGHGMQVSQADISCRLRIVELQQARIMERLGIGASSDRPENLRPSSDFYAK